MQLAFHKNIGKSHRTTSAVLCETLLLFRNRVYDVYENILFRAKIKNAEHYRNDEMFGEKKNNGSSTRGKNAIKEYY